MQGPVNTPLAGVVKLGREKCIVCGMTGELRAFLVYETVKCDYCGSMYPLSAQPIEAPRAAVIEEIRAPPVQETPIDRDSAMRDAMRCDRVSMNAAAKSWGAGAGRWKWSKCLDDPLTPKRKSRNLA